jgi:hypothetical protein
MALSAAPRQVTFNRHRFLQTYRHVAFVLQMLSCVATAATFVRICEQRHLPLVFLALPLLMFVVAIFCRVTPMREAGIMAIIVGATTGAVSGFVSTVVDNSLLVSADVIPFRDSNVAAVICSLEFLHIPVVVGAIMYTFCLLFTRLPPVTLLVLAVATAACGTTIFGIALTVVHDPFFTGDNASISGSSFRVSDWTAVLFVVFAGIFIASLLPLLHVNKRAWLVCLATLVASSYWQANFFDTMQWDWDRSHFPIPGTLVGIVLLYMIDVIQLTEAADVAGKRQSLRLESADSSPYIGDTILSTMTWHVGAYVVERTSLTFILNSRRSRLKPEQRGGSDVWLCCLGMLGLLSICSSYGSKLFTLFGRNVTICLALALYVCITATTGVLANGYFIDDILGLSIFATTATSDFATL